MAIQLKRDSAADWTSNNPTLASGRVGIETDTRRFKIGDGATAWASLSYAGEFFDGLFTEASAPSTPASGKVILYAKTDGLLYSKDDAGTETLVSGGSGGGGSGGTKTYASFSPLDNQPPATAFAQRDTRNSIPVLDFDATTEEAAVFSAIMPEAASLGSGLKVRIHWMATSATSGDCRWGVQFERETTDLDADSFDSATEATSSTNGTSGIITVTEITCTSIDSIVAGDAYRVKIYRDTGDAADTMAGDAELVRVEIRSAA